MSYVLHRIRKALADPPLEPMTHSLLVALTHHWQTLFAAEPEKCHSFAEKLKESLVQLQLGMEANQRHITCTLAMWETKRAAFQLDAMLGGPPGTPGPLHSSDWGTHWILFDWTAPATGAPPWGYRVERSTNNRDFIPAEICVETEVTLLNQPQGQKFYYRVVAFNGNGDGPPSAVFGILFDPALVD